MARTATARAPGRVNLIGEHTDYNRGLCLPVAIPYETTAVARGRDDDVVVLRSAQEDEWRGRLDDCAPGRVEGWAAYPGGVIWAMREAGRDVTGVEIELDSTVPVGAGLSSSAALEASVAVALAGLLDLDDELSLDDDLRRELTAASIRAEAEVVRAPTGGLDQTASLCTIDGGAVLIDFETDQIRPVALGLDDAGLALLVVDTRVSHTHVDSGYGQRREECERAAAALGVDSLRRAAAEDVEALDDDVLRRRARHVVSENQRVLDSVAAIEAGDWTRAGVLLTASHASMRDDFEISCPELDTVVDVALQAGALGARMTGGGFGGSAIALVPAERVDAVRRAVDAAFVRAGYRAPTHLDGTPSAPARLLERS